MRGVAPSDEMKALRIIIINRPPASRNLWFATSLSLSIFFIGWLGRKRLLETLQNFFFLEWFTFFYSCNNISYL